MPCTWGISLGHSPEPPHQRQRHPQMATPAPWPGRDSSGDDAAGNHRAGTRGDEPQASGTSIDDAAPAN